MSAICTNCGSDIPEQAIVTHTAYCERQRSKCAGCGVFIRNIEKAAHEQACLVKCDYCNFKTNPLAMPAHIDACNAPMQCEHCEKSIPRKELAAHKLGCAPFTCEYCNCEYPIHSRAEHREFCGAITEICECNTRIMRKEQRLHLQSGHKWPAPIRSTKPAVAAGIAASVRAISSPQPQITNEHSIPPPRRVVNVSIEKTECPICGASFSIDLIEDHVLDHTD